MACTCCLRGATGLTLAAFAAVAACASAGCATTICASPASSASRILIRLDFMLSLPADCLCVSELGTEVVLGRELESDIIARGTVVVGELAVHQLDADHHFGRGVHEQIDRGVL